MKSSNGLPTPVALVILLGAMAGTAEPALAATPITTCGYVISLPGDYSLTGDLVNCPLDGIDVKASGVGLKLNGHTISGSLGAGIYVNSFPEVGRLDHVGIEGPALIEGFGVGVEIRDTDYSQVDLVTVMGNGEGIIAAGNYLTVASNVATLNIEDGIRVCCTNNTITNNDASRNGNFGIAIYGGANSVSNNVADANSYGIQIAGSYGIQNGGARVWANVTLGNTISGISIALGVSAQVSAQVFSNTSSVGNGTDLVDNNAACGTDVWGGNVFFTSNAPCIR